MPFHSICDDCESVIFTRMTCTISRYYTLVLRDLNSIMRHDMTTLTIGWFCSTNLCLSSSNLLVVFCFLLIVSLLCLVFPTACALRSKTYAYVHFMPPSHVSLNFAFPGIGGFGGFGASLSMSKGKRKDDGRTMNVPSVMLQCDVMWYAGDDDWYIIHPYIDIYIPPNPVHTKWMPMVPVDSIFSSFSFHLVRSIFEKKQEHHKCTIDSTFLY